MKTLLALASVIFFSAAQAKDECVAPKICSEIQSSFEGLQKKTNEQKFAKFISLLEKASKKSCKIQGVKVLVPAYRVCYDQGFSTTTDSKGQLVIDKSFKGQMSEDAVLSWFIFADTSKFRAGKKFTRGKEFQSTLDGSWAETFSDQ